MIKYGDGLDELIGKKIKEIDYIKEGLILFHTDQGPRFFVWDPIAQVLKFIPMHDPEWVNMKIENTLGAYRMKNA